MNDLRVPDEAACSLWGAMEGHYLAAPHFTRLLDHEVEAIHREGLRFYSRQLFDNRIDEAVRRGFMSSETGEVLKEGSIPAAEDGRRGDRYFVWATVGRTFEERRSGVTPLMESWGGEGIYYSTRAQEAYKPLLRSLGRPAIVHLLLPPELAREMVFRPGIGRLLVGARRGLKGVSADARSDHPIPPEAIERVEFVA